MEDAANKTLVLYHRDCPDGVAAVWVYRHLMWHKQGMEFRAADYNDKFDAEDYRDRYVVMLDFSMKQTELIAILEVASSLLVIDHHASSLPELQEAMLLTRFKRKFDFRHNTEKCGTTLVWHEFADPCVLQPWWLAYIEDRDLWKWRLPDSREVSLAVQARGLSFTTFDILNAMTNRHQLATEGSYIMKFQQKLVDEICERAFDIELFGFLVPAVINFAESLRSDIGNRLCKGRAFAGIFWQEKGKWRLSLRSDENGENVAKLAERVGGGGHPHAARCAQWDSSGKGFPMAWIEEFCYLNEH
jgi:uncharacterized protein